MTYHRNISNQPSSTPRAWLAVFATLALATVLTLTRVRPNDPAFTNPIE